MACEQETGKERIGRWVRRFIWRWRGSELEGNGQEGTVVGSGNERRFADVCDEGWPGAGIIISLRMASG